MAIENTSLRIKATRLGTVSDVISLLKDIETAYNSIYAFDFIVIILLYSRKSYIIQPNEHFFRNKRI